MWIVPCFAGALLFAGVATSAAEDFLKNIAPLIAESCLDCHDSTTKTRLDFETLGENLSDPATFRQWLEVFDRAQKGKIPPPKKSRPDAELMQPALASLEKHLLLAGQATQEAQGRVPSRRLTRLEFGDSLHRSGSQATSRPARQKQIPSSYPPGRARGKTSMKLLVS
jgi:hypothetical protein